MSMCYRLPHKAFQMTIVFNKEVFRKNYEKSIGYRISSAHADCNLHFLQQGRLPLLCEDGCRASCARL